MIGFTPFMRLFACACWALLKAQCVFMPWFSKRSLRRFLFGATIGDTSWRGLLVFFFVSYILYPFSSVFFFCSSFLFVSRFGMLSSPCSPWWWNYVLAGLRACESAWSLFLLFLAFLYVRTSFFPFRVQVWRQFSHTVFLVGFAPVSSVCVASRTACHTYFIRTLSDSTLYFGLKYLVHDCFSYHMYVRIIRRYVP